MAITALTGPLVTFGVTLTSSGSGLTGIDLEHNDSRGPMLSDLGDALLDPRAAYNYKPGQGITALSLGFFNNYGDVDYVPLTANASAFVTSSYTSTAVTANFTLVSASSGLGTYATTIIAPETGKVSESLIAIDSTAAYLAFGTAGTVCVWNPGGGTGRAISITTSSSGDGGTFSIAGRDMYGFKMTETLAITQGTTNSSGYTITGQKAFKYISAISNTSTPVSTGVSIGFGNKFGFPLAVPYTGQNAVVNLCPTSFSSIASIGLSSANTVLASTAATQTSTTPDVRGTYTSSIATNGTLRLQMVVTPSASAVAAITSTNVAPLFGGTQFSSV
jgi:hypothetical protein